METKPRKSYSTAVNTFLTFLPTCFYCNSLYVNAVESNNQKMTNANKATTTAK